MLPAAIRTSKKPFPRFVERNAMDIRESVREALDPRFTNSWMLPSGGMGMETVESSSFGFMFVFR